MGRRGYQGNRSGISVLEDVTGREYNGVWKLWKFGSLGLFGVFVAILFDLGRTMRRIEEGMHEPTYEIRATDTQFDTPFPLEEDNLVEIGRNR